MKLISKLNDLRKKSITDSYGRTINYQYDVSDNRTSMTASDLVGQGGSLAYTYDSTNRLTSITSPLPFGERDRVRGHNSPLKKGDRGLSSGEGFFSFTYDPVGNRLTGPKDKLNYTYNQDNQLTEIMQTSQDVTLNSFQGLKEMLSQEIMKGSDQKKVEYTYDKNGNLTKKIEYDDDGNIKTITLYTYDFENRLIRVEMQRYAREKIIL